MLDPRLLEIICCPAEHAGQACHGDLAQTPAGLLCAKCGLLYPVVDGIPVMLQDHATQEVR